VIVRDFSEKMPPQTPKKAKSSTFSFQKNNNTSAALYLQTCHNFMSTQRKNDASVSRVCGAEGYIPEV